MEKIGVVVGERNGKVILELKRTGSCGDKCATCQSHCETPSIQVEIDNALHAKRGDFVEVGMKPGKLIRSTFIVYMIPLVMFILGMTVTQTLMKNQGIASYELIGILAGFAVLALTFVVIRLVTERAGKAQEELLKMNRIL